MSGRCLAHDPEDGNRDAGGMGGGKKDQQVDDGGAK